MKNIVMGIDVLETSGHVCSSCCTSCTTKSWGHMAIPSQPHKLVQNWEPLSNQNYELWEKLACYKIMGPDLGNKFHNGGSLQKQEVFFFYQCPLC